MYQINKSDRETIARIGHEAQNAITGTEKVIEAKTKELAKLKIDLKAKKKEIRKFPKKLFKLAFSLLAIVFGSKKSPKEIRKLLQPGIDYANSIEELEKIKKSIFNAERTIKTAQKDLVDAKYFAEVAEKTKAIIG